MTTPHKTAVLDAAEAELRSAYTLVVDPQCDDATAMPHLLRAWQAAAWLSREEVPEDGGDDLGAWLSAEHLTLLPESKRGAVHRTLAAVARHPRDTQPWDEEAPRPSVPSTKALLANMRALGGVIDGLADEQGGRSTATQLSIRWGQRAALWVGGIAAFVLIALRPWQDEEVGSWRGAYYPTEKFEGRPDIQRDVDVDFDWGKDPPTDSIPSDRFGARWDTCLVLDEDTDVAFQVISDDGSKVYIDGKVVIDNWEKHRPTAKGKRFEMTAGVHHLRVDYFEYKHDASIQLVASFEEGEPPSPIPSRMLEFPGMEFDDDANPCEGKS